MKLFSLVVVSLALTGLPPVVLAPQPSPQRGSEADFVKEKPTLGDPLPELTVYAPDGSEVSTARLRGHYTVLTFGCLT
jgi:hypothetical protein